MIFETLLIISTYLQCGYGQDFLWKDNNGKLVDSGKKQIIPKRWARSLYTWVHSPLINSVEQVIETDAEKSYSSTTVRIIRRLPRENTEKFEEEFFLWQDGEGNPLRFGLKQIDENQNIPFKQKNNQEDSTQQKEKKVSVPLWQNPLFYEDNNDLEDDSKDSHLLPFHEDGKLSHIIRSKFVALLNFFHPKNRASKTEFTTIKNIEEFSKSTSSEQKVKGVSNVGEIKRLNEREKMYQETYAGSSQNNSRSYLSSKALHSSQKNDLIKSENQYISKDDIDDPRKRKFGLNSSDQYQFKNNDVQIAEGIQDNKSLQKLFSQPKFHELSFIENSENDIDDADKVNVGKSNTNYDELNSNVLSEQIWRKMKRKRNHENTHPELRETPTHQFELYGTPK